MTARKRHAFRKAEISAHAHPDCADRWRAAHGSLPIGPGLRLLREGYSPAVPCCGVCDEPLDREAWEQATRRSNAILLAVGIAGVVVIATYAVAAWLS